MEGLREWKLWHFLSTRKFRSLRFEKQSQQKPSWNEISSLLFTTICWIKIRYDYYTIWNSKLILLWCLYIDSFQSKSRGTNLHIFVKKTKLWFDDQNNKIKAIKIIYQSNQIIFFSKMHIFKSDLWTLIIILLKSQSYSFCMSLSFYNVQHIMHVWLHLFSKLYN